MMQHDIKPYGGEHTLICLYEANRKGFRAASHAPNIDIAVKEKVVNSPERIQGQRV